MYYDNLEDILKEEEILIPPLKENNEVTLFCEVYCKFLNKITDDMYLELTYQDTIKLLKSMLITAIVNFRYPKINIRDYYLSNCDCITCDRNCFDEINKKTLNEDFKEYCDCSSCLTIGYDLKHLDHWNIKIGIDEIEILATIMKIDWLEQQINTKEILKMRPSSSDFELPSQANHIAKLTNWYNQSVIQLKNLQELYHRRKIDEKGNISPNFNKLGGKKNAPRRSIRV